MRNYRCNGGPYNTMLLLLESPGTIEFKVGNFKGYYDQQMNWIDTSK